MNIKGFLLPAFALFALRTAAQNKQLPVSSKIEKVTVFMSAAQTLRTGKCNLPKGKTELLFSGLSPKLDKQSIQLKGEGNFTVLSVIHQTNYLNEQKRREETEGLLAQKAALKIKTADGKNALKVFKNEESILTQNQWMGGKEISIKATELKEAADFQRARLTEVLLKQIELERNLKKLDSTANKIDQQLLALNQTNNFASSELLVTVTAQEPTAAVFELSYLVSNAGWYPSYDLRVKDIASPIDMSFKANIYQSSGEDWKEVKLSVSNGNPTESGMAPALQPWRLGFEYTATNNGLRNRDTGAGEPYSYGTDGTEGIINRVSGRVLDLNDGSPVPSVSIGIKGTSIGTITDGDGNYTINLPANATHLVFNYVGYKTQEVPIKSSIINVNLSGEEMRLEEVVVTSIGIAKNKRKADKIIIRGAASLQMETTEKQQATTVSFEIETPYTVMNDGKVYVADMKSLSVPAGYQYFAVPKLAKEAFLTAQITDWQDLNLMKGEANLFFEGAYLGKSVLDPENAGDTLSISLGKDKSIVINRKSLKELASKRFLGTNKTEERAFEISVRNNKALGIKILIEDQFPISTDKDIVVEGQEYKEGRLAPDTQKVVWEYDLPSKQEKKHLLKYSVKYPKNKTVVLE